MNKFYITNPNNLDKYLKLDISGFIFGIEKFSSEFNSYISLDNLSDLCDKCKNNNKDIIIFLNRLYFEHEIDSLKKLIIELSNYDVIIGFTDDAVLNILDEIGFKGDSMLISNHLGTNSYTINFYLSKLFSILIPGPIVELIEMFLTYSPLTVAGLILNI